MRYLVFLIVIGIFFSLEACTSKGSKGLSGQANLPDTVLAREKFISIFCDVLVAESAVAQQYNPNESKLVSFEKYRYNIYKRHGIDSTQFRQSYNYYLGHAKRAELFLFLAEDTLEARKKQLIPQKPTSQQDDASKQ